MNVLHLERNQPGRRTGLTRGGYRGGRLLRIIVAPALAARSSMGPKTITRDTKIEKSTIEEEDEEHIFRAPLSFSDSENEGNRSVNRSNEQSDSSGDERARTQETNIKSTSFKSTTTKEKPQSPTGEWKKDLIKGSMSKNYTNRSNTTTRSTRQKVSPLSRGNSSPKRKALDVSIDHKATKVDIFGDVKSIKRKKRHSAVYGSSQSNKLSSSQPITSNATLHTPITPQKAFHRINVKSLGDSDSDNDRPDFQKVDTSVLNEPSSTPDKPNFRTRKLADSPPSSRKMRLDPQVFRLLEEDQEEKPNSHSLSLDGAFDVSDVSGPSPLEEVADIGMIATQREPFRKYDLNGFAESTEDSLDEIADDFGHSFLSAHDADICGTNQAAICPMCKQPVDLQDLVDYGNMNTRLQEEFCRTHQKKTANKLWETMKYPKINWAKIDSRISAHHKFIRSLINGTDSHYRRLLIEKVDAGRDRSLMKMTSSLTPGYYGARGLQVISENIMHKFTPLLKKRIIKDRLMSSRGFTGYVQAVLVPEVAVLLIMEDMHIDIDVARTVLTDSAVVGELLHEELRDVAGQRVEDSDVDELAH